MAPEGVSVVTTTWNEKENIQPLIAQIHAALHDYPHEVIVVDDDSADGTFEVAHQFADVAVKKRREGQSKGLLYGMKLAKYPAVVTIDSDLENDPRHIPQLLKLVETFDVVNASRTVIPRVSERAASRTLGKLLGVKDVFSNYRAFTRPTVSALLGLSGGETFGAEFLVVAKKRGMRIGEFTYAPPPRRRNPRIGGAAKANLRILWALLKALAIYVS
jgi:dolichol-phosphate mannosyltransferase